MVDQVSMRGPGNGVAHADDGLAVSGAPEPSSDGKDAAREVLEPLVAFDFAGDLGIRCPPQAPRLVRLAASHQPW